MSARRGDRALDGSNAGGDRSAAVARVLLAFEPPDGGVAENAMQLALGLGELGYHVEVAGPPHAITYDRLAAAGIPIHRLSFERGYGHPSRDARALAGLIRLLRERGYDLLHCHSAKAGVIGRIGARVVRIPTVYSPHCFPFIGDFSETRRRFATAVERALGPATAAIVCVCEDERQQALAGNIAPANRLFVVHNGCEPCDKLAEPDRELANLRATGPVAAAVTVLRRQKRVDVFIDAARIVLDRMPAARLVVVGDGPLRAELEAQAESLGLLRDERFRFLPFRPPAARYLRAIDVYVLPSGWEAFPIGVLEALACGVPQVATDVGGTREAVTAATGVLVPPDDPGRLASAMVNLLADSRRRARMSEASKARHDTHFRLDRMVSETAAVYDSVLRRPRRARLHRRRRDR